MFKKDDLHKEINLFTTGSCSKSLLLRRDTVTESSTNLMTWHPSILLAPESKKNVPERTEPFETLLLSKILQT